MVSRARVMNSSCFFSVGFLRPDYYQTPTLFTLAVKENHSPGIKDFYRLGTTVKPVLSGPVLNGHPLLNGQL